MSESQSVLTDDHQYEIDVRPLCQGLPFVLTDAAHPRLVLKHHGHFLVLDRSAFMPACNNLGYGYYRNDTRYISQFEMFIEGSPISLLSTAIDEGYAARLLYTNPQIGNLPQQKVTVLREVVLHDMLFERLTFENFHNEPVEFDFAISMQSDFADMFEVRGLNLTTRGERMMPAASKSGHKLYLAYKGLDGILMETTVEFKDIVPDRIHDGEVHFRIKIPVRQSITFEMRIATRMDKKEVEHDPAEVDFESALMLARQGYADWASKTCRIRTDNELFDLSLKRGLRDLYILRQATPNGYGLAAGIPWYSAVFGRDSAIAAWQMLPFSPDLARECLQVLAAYQGVETNDFTAEQPGRIMHELRLGELARIKKIPHSPYFGTVDATQLWVMLYCHYVHWTGDLDFANKYWPNAQKAMQWLASTATAGNGYLYYRRISEEGLENQGWKDSGDSVMHKDGRLANPPIAICEAQAYYYMAAREMAKLSAILGNQEYAREMDLTADELKARFNKDYWMEEDQYLCIALDGEAKQVGALSSNPGHCLLTGILDQPKADMVAARLMSPELNTGWGIRTISEQERSYNPISYHNGSVWPHDNAIIAEGLRKQGFINEMHEVMKGMFETAQCQTDFRLPELFCGFQRTGSAPPIEYPVSCSPQAWAAGTMFQLLKACLNIEPDALKNQVRIVEPALPDWLSNVVIRGLRIGNATLDLSFQCSDGMTSCRILKKTGTIKVIIEN